MNFAQNKIAEARRIVIKIGSALLANIDTGNVKQDWIDALTRDVQSLLSEGKEIIIVSSGGVALGRSTIGIPVTMPPSKIPLELKQASSAVGQFHMFTSYYKAFSELGINVAQVLLTMSETENRRMHLNARATLFTLLERNIVPIINENDTVSTGEIRFGDNDRLAVRVAQMVSADLVILLSTTDGLYTDNPDKITNAKHIPIVEKIAQEHFDMAGDAIAGLSTGGMKSKIEAAYSANQAGISLMIANGRKNHALNTIIGDETIKSTLFLAVETKSNARKRWIQSHVRPKGSVTIDKGAIEALKSGKSLLPVGIIKIDGEFKRGDAIMVYDLKMNHIATGLSAHDFEDAFRIFGKSSTQIIEIMGYIGRTEFIHRDDLVLIT